MSKNIFENKTVEHSFNCCSTECFLSDTPHVSVFHFDTEDECYHASSLTGAAKMWVEGGMKLLHNVGQIG